MSTIITQEVPVSMEELWAEIKRLKEERAEVARLINCAGPIIHRVQVFLRERSEALTSSADFERMTWALANGWLVEFLAYEAGQQGWWWFAPEEAGQGLRKDWIVDVQEDARFNPPCITREIGAAIDKHRCRMMSEVEKSG